MADEANRIEESNEDEEGYDDDSTVIALKNETAQFVESEAVREAVARFAAETWDEGYFGARWDWLVVTIAKYQEMPTLLSPHLEPILGPVFERLIITMTGFGLMSSRASDAEGKHETMQIKVYIGIYFTFTAPCCAVVFIVDMCLFF
jgi:hypothetical protein